jgi:hypothetical protein
MGICTDRSTTACYAPATAATVTIDDMDHAWSADLSVNLQNPCSSILSRPEEEVQDRSVVGLLEEGDVRRRFAVRCIMRPR